jgi:hypothetical protein
MLRCGQVGGFTVLLLVVLLLRQASLGIEKNESAKTVVNYFGFVCVMAKERETLEVFAAESVKRQAIEGLAIPMLVDMQGMGLKNLYILDNLLIINDIELRLLTNWQEFGEAKSAALVVAATTCQSSKLTTERCSKVNGVELLYGERS